MNYEEDNPIHLSTMFSQAQYKKWRLYDFLCDPKVLATHNLVETLFMRLSFHLRDEVLLDTLRRGDVIFGPFSLNSNGAYDLSYHSLAWYLGHLPKGGDEEVDERHLEREWCEYAMQVAEGVYLKEVVEMGYGEDTRKGKPLDAQVFRMELMLYVTKLRGVMKHNDIAHVFSTSVKQVWTKSIKGKNRCLLDEPAPLEDGYKKKLVAILNDLALDIPDELRALGNIIPIQAYFLKSVLQNSFNSENFPKPTKLPRTLPPPIN